mgnify:CR=1 FL=1
MVETGIVVEDSAIEEYTKLRMKRAYRYIIFKISDNKTKIEIEHLGERDATFAQFKDMRPKDQCR